MEKYGSVGQGTDDDIMRVMRFACWPTKARNTHPKHVTLTAFPKQQRLYESVSALRLLCCSRRKHVHVRQFQQMMYLVDISGIFFSPPSLHKPLLLHSELALSLVRGTEVAFCYYYSNVTKKPREFSTLPEVAQFTFITQLARNVSSAAHDHVSLRKVLMQNDAIYLGYTDMGKSNGNLPLRICPGCSVPEPYRSPDWVLVPAKTGLRAEYQ